MLQKLQKNWMIESLDFHVKGYWELDSAGKAFDLRLLQSKPESTSPSNIPYLTTRNNHDIIQFDSSAFYEIDRVEDHKLVMTYYVLMATGEREELVRVFTIRLMMQ